jgi:hypothetical protein
MGTVFKKQTTRPLPDGVEVFTKSGQRYAKWKAGKRTRTAKLTTGRDGSERIVTESPTWLAKFRDGGGIIREVSTGCKDETAARAVLAELEKRAELVKSRVLTPEQDNVANQQDVPVLEHVEAFVNRRTKRAPNGVTLVGPKNSRARLTRLANECGFRVLSDLRSDALDRWMREQLAGTMSPANINEFRNELVIFANWCVRNRRLLVNPFNDVPKLDASANPRRKRRSMTEAELVKLLRVARWRPLAESGRLGPHSRPRFDCGRHSEERRTRTHNRRSCSAALIRNAAEQRRRCSAHGSSGHASQGHRVDDDDLHRSEVARRARGVGCSAIVVARHASERTRKTTSTSDRNRRGIDLAS